MGGWYGFAALQIAGLLGVLNTRLPVGADEELKAVFGLLKNMLGDNFWLFVVHLFALYTAAMLLSHLLHGYIKRRRWTEVRWRGKVWRVLLTGLLLSAPLGLVQQFTAAAPLHQMGTGIPWLDQLQRSIQWAPYFWVWLIAYFVILNQRRLRFADLHRSELTRALQQSELRSLKAQLNPHFLFNSLNSVRALVADNPARAQSAITQLARTLRYTLGSGKDELVTLKQELEIVDDYLALEALRLDQRLKVERDIAAEALRERIPVMLLQTVVENAIKHGIAELPAGGVLRISGQVQERTLQLVVENPRPAQSTPPAHESVGLRNATERLRLLFGDGAKLDLDLSSPERATARIRIPIQG